MPLDTLNRIIDAEFTRQPLPKPAARNPYDLLGGDGGAWAFGGDSDFGSSAEHDEQLNHYRGRFYAAARVICARFAQQPIYVGRRGVVNPSRSIRNLITKGAVPPTSIPDWIGPRDRIELLNDHPALTAMLDPNPVMTAYNLKEVVCESLLATGRAFLVATGSVTPGRMLDVYAIPATWMTPVNNPTLFSGWKCRPPGSHERPLKLSAEQVVHCYFADPAHPARAISALSMLGRSVLTDEAIASTQLNEFKRGVMPKVALIAGDLMNETSFTDDPNRTSSARPVRLEPYQRQQLITWVTQHYGGAINSNRPLILDAVIRDIKILSRTPAEMAFMDSARLTEEQIFSGLGVPMSLTGKLENVNRASGALAEQFFADYTLNPMITLFSQALSKRFGPLFSDGGEQLLMWMAPMQAKDTELRVEMLHLGIRSYSLTRNEVRDILREEFGGLERRDDFDDVVMPQTLEERDDRAPSLGVGRIAVDAEERRFSSNGRR